MPETTNLKLPTFNPDDKPSWLGSWNGAMNTIDQAVGRIDGDIAETDASIQEAQTSADAAKTAADAAQAATTALQGKVDQNKTDIQRQAAMIETLQDDVSSINIPSVIGQRYEGRKLSPTNTKGSFTVNSLPVYGYRLGNLKGHSGRVPCFLLTYILKQQYGEEYLITPGNSNMKIYLMAAFTGNVFGVSYSQLSTSVTRIYHIAGIHAGGSIGPLIQGIGYIYVADLNLTLLVFWNNSTNENTYYMDLYNLFVSDTTYVQFSETSLNISISGSIPSTTLPINLLS